MISAHNEQDQKSVAFVSDCSTQLGSYLSEFLLNLNCIVVGIASKQETENANLEKLKNNPLFYFAAAGDGLEENIATNFDGFIDRSPSYFFDLSKDAEIKKIMFSLCGRFHGKYLEIVENGGKPNKLTQEIDYRSVSYKELYGPRMDLNSDSSVALLFKGFATNSDLIINGDGSEKISPIYISDLIYGITKAIFSPNTQDHNYLFRGKKPISVLELAQEIKKAGGDKLKIRLTKKKKYDLLFLEDSDNGESLSWEPKISLSEGIEETVDYFKALSLLAHKNQKSSNKAISHSRPLIYGQLPKKKRLVISKVGVFLFFLLLFPLFILGPFFLSVSRGINSLRNFEASVSKKDYKGLLESSSRETPNFESAAKIFSLLEGIAGIAGQGDLYLGTQSLFYLGDKLEKASVSLVALMGKGSELGRSMLQDEEVNFESLLSEMRREGERSYELISLVEAELKSNKNIFKAANYWGVGESLKDQAKIISGARKMILGQRRSVDLLSSFIGVDGKKTYLVLFQNNQEIRPTGGFIGSIGLLEFNKGRLAKFEIFDSYSVDGQLKGHVEPPLSLKTYLGEAGWYLRDSNWDPGFSSSARKAAWFFEKETGQVVDGVIGIDLYTVQGLLDAVGDVEMVDFKENINSANLFEKAEYYSEVGFFPGSTQKKDFLASLGRALFERIKNSNSEVWSKIVVSLSESITSKDLLIYFDEPEPQLIAKELGVSGELISESCEDDRFPCLSDYLMLVEANVGVNKANYFLKRDISHKVEFLQNSEVAESVDISYVNESVSEVFPGGTYKDYLRVLVPRGSILDSVEVDGERVEENVVDQGEIGGKTYFGFYFEVPPGARRNIRVTYRLSETVPSESIVQYRFLMQKQPGIKGDQVVLRFSSFMDNNLLTTSVEKAQNKNSLVYNSLFDKDISLELSLAK